MSKQPDYLSYTLEQLERARRTIDVARFPERAALLDDMIAERKQRHTVPQPLQVRGPFANTDTLREPRLRVRTPVQALFALLITLSVGAGGWFWSERSGISINEATLPIFVCGGLLTLLFATHWLLEYHTLKSSQQP